MKPSLLNLILGIAALCCTSNSNAQTASRLIAVADSSNMYPDSVYYLYSAGRGGDLTHPIKFDLSYSIQRDIGIGDTQITLVHNSYDRNNNIVTTIKMDAFEDPSFPSPPVFSNTEKDSNAYDAHSNVIGNFVWTPDPTNPSSWHLQDSVFYTYDSHNNMILSVFPGLQKDTFIYDGSNNLMVHTILFWDNTTAKWHNNENYVNKYIGTQLQSTYEQLWFYTDTSWTNAAATEYYYNSSNDLVKKIQYQQDPVNYLSGILIDGQIDSNIYNTTHDLLFSYHARFYPTLNLWQLSRDSSVYDTRHNQLATAQQNYDTASAGYISIAQLNTRYNSFDQATYIHSKSFITMPFSDYAARLYYETYTPTVVPSAYVTKGALKLFPNPANSLININLSWDEPQAFTIMLYDMQGRLMRQWSEQKADRYQKQIPVSDLPAGNYIISIKGEHGQLQRQLSIVH